mmetsp:Transcript_104790/g.281648  ORF Transcript_104790/g.281648 Transcript_104790/m.281648 type:complete len:363 (+) Transcript_104790:408-1496(+)
MLCSRAFAAPRLPRCSAKVGAAGDVRLLLASGSSAPRSGGLRTSRRPSRSSPMPWPRRVEGARCRTRPCPVLPPLLVASRRRTRRRMKKMTMAAKAIDSRSRRRPSPSRPPTGPRPPRRTAPRRRRLWRRRRRRQRHAGRRLRCPVPCGHLHRRQRLGGAPRLPRPEASARKLSGRGAAAHRRTDLQCRQAEKTSSRAHRHSRSRNPWRQPSWRCSTSRKSTWSPVSSEAGSRKQRATRAQECPYKRLHPQRPPARALAGHPSEPRRELNPRAALRKPPVRPSGCLVSRPSATARKSRPCVGSHRVWGRGGCSTHRVPRGTATCPSARPYGGGCCPRLMSSRSGIAASRAWTPTSCKRHQVW